MKQILDFFNILVRWLTTGVITGVLVIVYKVEKDKIYYLLLQSKEYSTWHFVSGSCGWNESLEETAKKELSEEVDSDVYNLQKVPILHTFRYRNLPFKPKSIQTIYISRLTKEMSNMHPKNEIVELKWIEKDKVLSYITFPELQDTFSKVDAYILQNAK